MLRKRCLTYGAEYFGLKNATLSSMRSVCEAYAQHVLIDKFGAGTLFLAPTCKTRRKSPRNRASLMG